MASIKNIQTQRVLEEITRALLVRGVAPSTDEILTRVSEYFNSHPIGTPVSLPLEPLRKGRVADPEDVNAIMSHMLYNIDVLYEAALSQVDDIMLLNSVLNANVQQLRARRKSIEARIDDFLLSQYNTDGYYFSRSDTFSDLDNTDVTLTSAFVDTVSGTVSLPGLGSHITQVSPDLITLSSVEVTVNGVAKSVTRDLSGFTGATDGLTNTVWGFEIDCDKQSEVVVTINIVLGGLRNVVNLSRVQLLPYGVQPVQAFVRSIDNLANANPGASSVGFGNSIQTSSERMIFSDEVREVSNVIITLRKTEADYKDERNGTTTHRYIFGAKELTFFSYAYDNQATFVSGPLDIHSDLTEDLVIDAVSLVVDHSVPDDTEIQYYVAVDSGQDPIISNFDWRAIEPVGGNDVETSVVRFDGARFFSTNIKKKPSAQDLQLIALDDTNTDLTKRNPSATIFPTKDVYRIAAFTDTPLLNSIKLEEGINSTRIYHVPLETNAVDGLSFWVDQVSADGSSVTYGDINSGYDFFYGGDVGSSGRSVYVETYLESISDQETFIGEFRKKDPNSKTWTVRVLLNGRSVAYLPPNTDTSLIPWAFKRGLNHIALLINIPAQTTAYPHPEYGTVDLITGTTLDTYGTVKLGTWTYIDPFDLQYNQLTDAQTFTIENNELISLRKPTTNFRLQYQKPTQLGPGAIRLRADLSRSINKASVSPIINSYRLRFLYGSA